MILIQMIPLSIFSSIHIQKRWKPWDFKIKYVWQFQEKKKKQTNQHVYLQRYFLKGKIKLIRWKFFLHYLDAVLSDKV